MGRKKPHSFNCFENIMSFHLNVSSIFQTTVKLKTDWFTFTRASVSSRMKWGKRTPFLSNSWGLNFSLATVVSHRLDESSPLKKILPWLSGQPRVSKAYELLKVSSVAQRNVGGLQLTANGMGFFEMCGFGSEDGDFHICCAS